MRAKYFSARLLNLLLILAMLCAYQMVALDRAEKEAAALEKARQEQAKNS